MISLPAPHVYTWVRFWWWGFFFFLFQKQLKSFRQDCNLNSWWKTSEQQRACPGWTQHRCQPMKAREHIGISGMLRRCGPTSLARPTMLEQSPVWGQQQCRGVAEMADNVVVSVQGEMNWWHPGGAVSLPFYVSFPLPWSPGWVLLWAGTYGYGPTGAVHRVGSLHRHFRGLLSIFAKLGTAELWQAGFLKHKRWKNPSACPSQLNGRVIEDFLLLRAPGIRKVTN